MTTTREVGEGFCASAINATKSSSPPKVGRATLAWRDFERLYQDSLAELELLFVDLLLIHGPNPEHPAARHHRDAVQHEAGRVCAPHRR